MRSMYVSTADLITQCCDHSSTMGSKHSTPSKASRDPRALAEQAASRINAQQRDGVGPPQIAAAVPDGRDALFFMLRRDEQGQYAYDQEYYERSKEYTREHGERRGRRTRDARGGHVKGHVAQQGDQQVPAGLRGDRGSQGGVGEQGARRAPNEARGQGRRPDGQEGKGKHGARESKGRVEADTNRRAFVRHKRLEQK